MGSFGERLRQQREVRGIALEEIVATTKIGRRLLLALEEEQFDLLPGGIFNKSYVRAYARCVGIDEDKAVAEYLEASQEPPPDNKVIAHQHTFHSDRRAERAGFPVVPVLILVVVVIGAVGGWKAYQDHQKERARQIAPTDASTTSSSSGAPPATGSAETPIAQSSPSQATPLGSPVSEAENQSALARQPTPNAQAAATGSGQFEVTIRPKERAWVSVKSDGKYVVQGIIRPPEVKTIHASSQVVFYTGNAGQVEVAFNGKNVALSGGANHQETVVFGSKGVVPKAPAQ